MSYNDYLNSEHWKEQRERSRQVFDKHGCVICGKKKYDIHHITYRNLGHEKTSKDLIPLCRDHHGEFHRWLWAHPSYNEADIEVWLKQSEYKKQYALSGYQSNKIKPKTTKALKTRCEIWKLNAVRFYDPTKPFLKISKTVRARLVEWRTEMLDFLGVPQMPYNDRIEHLIGMEIPMETYREFMKRDWYQD
ncbi:MAG: hypothetical protein KGI71_06230 [Patescibacteria group bacterium]|nr:hypothetical protein [Patescibacteria group bacterium]